MELEIPIPLIVEIATIILLLVAIGALLGIIKIVDGRLLKGWRIMLVAFVIAIITQVLTVLYTSGIMRHPFHVYARFVFTFVGLIALWHMAKTFDDCRVQARRR